MAGHEWANEAWNELGSMDNVSRMLRTTVFGTFDHGIYGALERRTDHLPNVGDAPRMVVWRIHSRRTVLCAGATERSIAFPMNDRPGVMLAGAVRCYVNRFGVAPGRRVAVFANNEGGQRTAEDLRARDVEVAAVVDTRSGGAVVDTRGRRGLRSVILNEGGQVDVDCLAVSGGWSPNLHLACHQHGRPKWRDDIAAFVPGGSLPPGMSVVGAAQGEMTLAGALLQGHDAGGTAVSDLGFSPVSAPAPSSEGEFHGISAFWQVKGSKLSWVDLQNDVTCKDIRQSHQEGFGHVEHPEALYNARHGHGSGKNLEHFGCRGSRRSVGNGYGYGWTHNVSSPLHAGFGRCPGRQVSWQGVPPRPALHPATDGLPDRVPNSSKSACGYALDGSNARVSTAGVTASTGR